MFMDIVEATGRTIIIGRLLLPIFVPQTFEVPRHFAVANRVPFYEV